MCAGQAFVVHWAVLCADFVPPALACHTEDLGETLAYNHCSVIQPLCTWKISLATCWIVWPPAVHQRYSLALLVYVVHVVLLQLSQCLDIVGKVLIQPPPVVVVATLASAELIRRTCNDRCTSSVLWPCCFVFLRTLLRCTRVCIHSPGQLSKSTASTSGVC